MNRLLFLLLATISLVYSDEFSVAVQGKFTCLGEPYPGVSVELIEEDLVWDDTLDKTISSGDGSYKVQGHKDERWYITPYLQITHRCPNERKQTCLRTMKRYIPKEAIMEGKVITRFFEMDLELGNTYRGETKDC